MRNIYLPLTFVKPNSDNTCHLVAPVIVVFVAVVLLDVVVVETQRNAEVPPDTERTMSEAA